MLLFLFSGCRAGLGSTGVDAARVSGPPSYGEPSELVAWVEVEPTTFRAGEIVHIEVGLRNPTSQPIVVGFTSGCTLHYGVRDERQLYVAPFFVCTMNAPARELAAGQSLLKSFEWNGTNVEGAPLPAGNYVVSTEGFLSPAKASVTIQILDPSAR